MVRKDNNRAQQKNVANVKLTEKTKQQQQQLQTYNLNKQLTNQPTK